MGLLDVFRGDATKANRAQAIETQTFFAASVSPHYRDFRSYLDAYKLPWVNACVRAIAYNAANVRGRLLLPGADDGEDREITASPLLNLLERPNPDQTRFELFEEAWTDLELTGNAFLALESATLRGLPTEMYRLRPDCVQVIPGQDRRVGGYVYTVRGHAVRYGPDEVLHLKYANPIDPLYGMGIIEAGEARFDSDRAMALHERDFWLNGAKITGVFQAKDSLDDNRFARLAANMRRFFRGSGYGTLLLEGGVEYKSVSDGPAKLGLLELSKASRDAILALFGVPPTKVGILENANYKATASDQMFWSETIDPKLTRMEQSLGWLIERFHPGSGYVFRFDRLNFEDDLPALESATKMAFTGSFTLDEIRTYLGKDPLGPEMGGGLLLVPNRFALTDGAQAVQQANAPLQVTTTVLPQAALPPPAGKSRTSSNRPASALVLLRVRDRTEKAGLAKAPEIARFFVEQERRVTANLASHKRHKAALRADDLWDHGTEDNALRARLRGIHEQGLRAGYDAANAVGVDIGFDLENPRLQEASASLAERVTGINGTTKDAIKDQVAEGLRRGYSVRQIADGVTDESYGGITGVFEHARGYRAEMIARTETMAAFSKAATAAYGEAGIQRVELLDGTGDKQCSARNGQVVSLREAMGIEDHPNGTLCLLPVVEAA